jgi:hypothetical protein
MNAVSKNVLLRCFSSSLPICPVYFHLVMPRHILSPCYARYEHTGGIKGYVAYDLACYVRLQAQSMLYSMRLRVPNMPGCHLRKYRWGKCRLEEKIAAFLLYWLHSFHLACLMFSMEMPSAKIYLHNNQLFGGTNAFPIMLPMIPVYIMSQPVLCAYIDLHIPDWCWYL